MNKLTAEKCRELVKQLRASRDVFGPLPEKEDYKLQALEIALPILERGEGEGEWVDWGGGDMPVAKGSLVDVRYRNGEELFGIPAGEANNNSSEPDAHQAYWDNDGLGLDIIAYRIIPEQPTNQNGEQ